MEWKVRIGEAKFSVLGETKSSKAQLLIQFKPLTEEVVISGQYKIENKWVDFVEERYSMNLSIEQLNDALFDIELRLRKRLERFKELNTAFSLIEAIEPNKED